MREMTDCAAGSVRMAYKVVKVHIFSVMLSPSLLWVLWYVCIYVTTVYNHCTEYRMI